MFDEFWNNDHQRDAGNLTNASQIWGNIPIGNILWETRPLSHWS